MGTIKEERNFTRATVVGINIRTLSIITKDGRYVYAYEEHISVDFIMLYRSAVIGTLNSYHKAPKIIFTWTLRSNRRDTKSKAMIAVVLFTI